VEDSRNGVRAAVGAGLPVLVTQSTYTQGEDFSGSIAVLSDLGEPNAPFSALAGPLNSLGNGATLVDTALLRRLRG
jgi:beta-phosphoglucomutase-like phosphatase (HAD superfamily)